MQNTIKVYTKVDHWDKKGEVDTIKSFKPSFLTFRSLPRTTGRTSTGKIYW